MTDLVQLYLDETDHIAHLSPALFREWAGVCGVAAALGRRVWTQTIDGRPIYPNLYVVLVADAAGGKTEAFQPLTYALSQVDGIVFSPEEITHAEMISHMGKVFAIKDSDGAPIGPGERSYVALVGEIATYFPEGSGTTLAMQSLARIWDCPEVYRKATKTSGRDNLHWPVLNFIAAAQPGWFAEGFPSNSFSMGFPSRTLFVHSGERPRKRFTATGKSTVKEYRKLWNPMVRLSNLSGYVPFAPEALSALQQWHDGGDEPRLNAPLLASYAERRPHHVAKLALGLAMSTHPGEQIVTLADLERAWELLFRTERTMPQAVAAAGGNIYAVREEGVARFVEDWYRRKTRACPEWEVRARLAHTLPSPLIDAILEAMVARRLVQATGKAPERSFKPGVKR